MNLPYNNRREAGQELAARVRHLADRQPLVLALPRGGVPVAYEIAETLEAPLDLLLVRKLGVPGHEELAFGAIASGGARVLNPDVVNRLGISHETIEAVTNRERAELERRARAYRADEPEPDVEGRTVVVVDDGLATGATMRAGISALRQSDPAGIVVAVPVGPPDSVDDVASEAEEVICPATPAAFVAIGHWYVDFAQTSDEEVRDLLRRNWNREAAARRSPR